MRAWFIYNLYFCYAVKVIDVHELSFHIDYVSTHMSIAA